MRVSQLVMGGTYVDITDKKVPLRFSGNVQRDVNIGWNAYVDRVEFVVVRTEQNKNYDLPNVIYKNFNECDANNDLIIKFEDLK